MSKQLDEMYKAIPFCKIKEEVIENDDEITSSGICDQNMLTSDAFGLSIRSEHHHPGPAVNTKMSTDGQTHVNYYDIVQTAEQNSSLSDNKFKIEIEVNVPCVLPSMKSSGFINNVMVKSETGPEIKVELVEEMTPEEDIENITIKSEPRTDDSSDYLTVNSSAYNSSSKYTQQGTTSTKKVDPNENGKVKHEERLIDKEVTAKSLKNNRRLSKNVGTKEKCVAIKKKGPVKTARETIIDTNELICNICNYAFKKKYNLQKHLRIHSGEKPFGCHICNFKSNDKSSVKRHLTTHTGEKLFPCHICDYKCNNRSHLKTHIRMHTGEKPFSCNICDYTCTRNSMLKVHSISHTGKKPFSCQICNAKFNYSSSLKGHMKSHTGEKPFACDICDYKCYKNSMLKIHMRTHTFDRPYVCDICVSTFKYKSTLKNHIIRLHQNTY